MIHEIGVELSAQLAAKGLPIRVIDGPERRPTDTFANERIVIEHDSKGDTFESRHLADKNPRTYMTRKIGVKITIYAQSPSANALEFEHRRRAEHILDMVLVALVKIAQARHNGWTPKSGKFVYTGDLAASEVWGGVVYELEITFDRGVADRTWAGQAAPTVSTGGVGGVPLQSKTEVSLASTVPDDGSTPPDNGTGFGGGTETACGGS